MGYFTLKLKLRIKEKIGMLIITPLFFQYFYKPLILFIDRMIGVGYCTKQNDKEIGDSNVKYICDMLMPGNSRFYSIFYYYKLISNVIHNIPQDKNIRKMNCGGVVTMVTMDILFVQEVGNHMVHHIPLVILLDVI